MGYYEITISNLTRGQTFTPILVASHSKHVKLFELGEAASVELSQLAEDGAVAPMKSILESDPRVGDVNNSGGLLKPGESVVVMVDAHYGARRISLASMMIPTNDAFIALNGVKVPRGHRTVTYQSVAYDAGSEMNDELCDNIPGPVCGGEGFPPDDGEGYVHIHSGIHGIGDDLDPKTMIGEIQSPKSQSAKLMIVTTTIEQSGPASNTGCYV